MAPERPHDADNDESPSSTVAALWRDERAVASQVDFLVSMFLRAAALSLFVVIGAALLLGVTSSSPDGKLAAERASSTLTDDLLVDPVGNDTLDRTCTQAFFEQDTSVCNFDDDWTNGDRDYLNAALRIQFKNINVTIHDESGAVSNIGGTDLVEGPSIPTDNETTVHQWSRYTPVDVDGDGTQEWRELTVSVWT